VGLIFSTQDIWLIFLSGFEYNFDSIEDESNELFTAYKDMFETAISQNNDFRTILGIYAPFLKRWFPDVSAKTVERCQSVIRRVAGQLIQEKKAKAAEGGKGYQGRDLLSLLLRSNSATDLPPEQRISDEDILHNINTFMFAGSDTTSLALTWTLLLLAQNSDVQTRLRKELLQILPPSSMTTAATAANAGSSFPDLSTLSEDEINSLYTVISEHPLLDNVCRESLRLVPPVHSSLRVARQDDIIPTLYPVMRKGKDGVLKETDRKHVVLPKGTFVHVPIEAFNLDRHVWGSDAWKFKCVFCALTRFFSD
jgi:cytochrome P450